MMTRDEHGGCAPDGKATPTEAQDSICQCIAGLTAYAASLAGETQSDKLQWLYSIVEDMTFFWSLDAPKQYITAFEQAVSEACSSRQALELSEQDKANILAGMERYIDEMQTNGEEQEPWFKRCSDFMQELQAQWKPVQETISEENEGRADPWLTFST